MEKIALIVDSGSDISIEQSKKYNIDVVPLYINYTDKSYKDVFEINASEVCKNFEKEIPKTSVPSFTDIENVIRNKFKEGYTSVIMVTISANLSGFYNAVRLVSEEFSDKKIEIINSKAVALSSGFLAIYASELIKEGYEFEEIVKKLNENVKNTKVYFTVKNLEYLIKGGRIGLVSGMIGSLLKIKPIISCNEEGIYYTIAKARGENKARKKLVEIAKNQLKNSGKVYISIADFGYKEGSEALHKELGEIFENAHIKVLNEISPALGVHTGPGLLGLCIFCPK